MSDLALVGYVILCWAIFSLVCGIIDFFQKDHKFGQYNFDISALVVAFVFFSPLLLPCLWLSELYHFLKEKNERN